MKERTIRASALSDYLNISYSTMDTWFKNGLLGDKFVNLGRGKFREFSFEDVCAARVVQEVISISQSTVAAKKAGEFFYNRDKESLIQNHLEYMMITFARNDIYFAWSRSGRDAYPADEEFPKGHSIILVPITEIMSDVVAAFPDLVKEE